MKWGRPSLGWLTGFREELIPGHYLEISCNGRNVFSPSASSCLPAVLSPARLLFWKRSWPKVMWSGPVHQGWELKETKHLFFSILLQSNLWYLSWKVEKQQHKNIWTDETRNNLQRRRGLMTISSEHGGGSIMCMFSCKWPWSLVSHILRKGVDIKKVIAKQKWYLNWKAPGHK